MRTVVLPLCEKCDKPILDGMGVIVDGIICLMREGYTGGDIIAGGNAPHTYHLACLRTILSECSLKAAKQQLSSAAERVSETLTGMFSNVVYKDNGI